MKSLRAQAATRQPISTRMRSSPVRFFGAPALQDTRARQQNLMQAARSPVRQMPFARETKEFAAVGTNSSSATIAGSFISTSAAGQKNAKNYSAKATTTPEPIIHSLFEEHTGTWQYVVADPSTKKAVIIDSVLDYDPKSHVISTETADALLAAIAESGYQVEKILETHAHADHLTAAAYLQKRLAQRQGAKPPICIGRRIEQVQELFARKYGISADEYEDVFDHLFEDDETFSIGELTAKVIHLPGHTPDHVGYRIGENVFCGDSIFHADIGSARCDFPGGSAKSLYGSGRKLLALPDHFKIWTGHDYPACPQRCEAVPWMTVKDHKEKNKHLSENVKEDDFLALREKRDATLAAPRLLDASLQINICAGRLPKPTEGGYRLIRLPFTVRGISW